MLAGGLHGDFGDIRLRDLLGFAHTCCHLFILFNFDQQLVSQPIHRLIPILDSLLHYYFVCEQIIPLQHPKQNRHVAPRHHIRRLIPHRIEYLLGRPPQLHPLPTLPHDPPMSLLEPFQLFDGDLELFVLALQGFDVLLGEGEFHG